MRAIVLSIPFVGLLFFALSLLFGTLWFFTQRGSGHHKILRFTGRRLNCSNEFTSVGAKRSQKMCACCGKKTYLNYLANG